MPSADSSAVSTPRASADVQNQLLKHKLQIAEVRDSCSDKARYQVEPIDEELSFDKGFFLFVRAVQLLLAHNDGVVMIGVAGPSGAGKTIFCKKVMHFLPGSAVLAMDMYNDASQVVDGNFDDPRLTDYELLLENISGLREGRAVDAPIYDFKKSQRTGFRKVDVPKSRVVVIEGIYALSAKLRPLLDLRVAITGGVHFDLIKRVLRDTTRAAQAPEEIIQQISETVYPMYKAYIEPDLKEAHLKIVNTFNPFSGFQNPTYKLKSSNAVSEADVCVVLGACKDRKQVDSTDMYLLPPSETAETCQTWLRMRNTNGRYTLIFEETMSDGPFIISPSISFEVSVRILGGLMALGYSIGAMMKRRSTSMAFVVDGGSVVDVKLDNVEGLGEYVQVQGEDRNAVAATGRALGLESSYIPQSYIEEVQLQQMIQHFRDHDEDVIRIATDSHRSASHIHAPKPAMQIISNGNGSGVVGAGGGSGSMSAAINGGVVAGGGNGGVVNGNGNGGVGTPGAMAMNGYMNGHMNGGHHHHHHPQVQVHAHPHPVDAMFGRAMSPSPSSFEMPTIGLGGVGRSSPPMDVASSSMAAETIRVQSQLDVIRHEAKDIMAAITRIELSLMNSHNHANPGGHGHGNGNGASSSSSSDMAFPRLSSIGSESGWLALGSILVGVVLGTAISVSMRSQ